MHPFKESVKQLLQCSLAKCFRIKEFHCPLLQPFNTKDHLHIQYRFFCFIQVIFNLFQVQYTTKIVVTWFFSWWKDCKKEWTINLKVFWAQGWGREAAEVLNINHLDPFSWPLSGLNAHKNYTILTLFVFLLWTFLWLQFSILALKSFWASTLLPYLIIRTVETILFRSLINKLGWILWNTSFFSTS